MKVPAGLPLACCCWLVLAVTSTLARPQKLQLTPREFKAFKTVLGNKRALSITSAVPVMAFSDKNPTKYVELPLDQIGGQTGHPSPAELLDTTSEKFGTVYGRGAGSSGPAFGGSETGKYQGVVNFNAGDLQRGGEYDSVASDSRVFGPDKVVPLTYGFKPIYDSVSSSQGIIPKKAPGGLVRASFSPSKQVGQGLFRPITSSKGDDGLLERTPKLGSDENLFRHHVDSSLVSTTGGGPGTKAVGKLLKSRNPELDESDVVVRSVDGRTILNALLKEANAKTLIDVSGGALQSSAAVGASIAVHDSSKGQLKSFKEEKLSLDLHELSSGGFVSDSGAIVVRGGDSKAREALPDPSASIFDSSRIEASSIFPSNSVRIPQLPNIQLPLQTQEARSFEGQELPLETSQSTFTGNQQQVKLIIEQSNSQKRQVPQIPNSVKPSVKTTATANTESLLRLLRSQAPSEPEPTTSQGKFTREISPQARQIPGAIPSKVSPSGTTSAIPPGFRPIPATPRQNSRRSANPSSEQTRTSIKFNNVASQQAQRPQVTQPQPSTRSIQQSKTTQQVSSTRPVQQPRTNTQIGAVSHQFQQQFHPQFSPGPFTANPQTNSANQLKKLQQRQQQQQQEQKQRVQVQEKRQDQLKEQQVLQQLAERYEKQQQRQQQQSQQQREQQQRQQRQQQHQQKQQQQQQQQQQQRQQPLQQQQQQQRQQPLQQQKQQQQHQFLQQQNQQQRQQPLQQQKQQQQHQSLQQQKQQQQHQQQKSQQSGRLGTKVTSGQRQTLEEFLAGNSKPVSQLQQPNLQQTQTRVITKSNTVQAGFQQAQHSAIAKPTAQQPRLQQSNVKQTFTAGTQQLGSQAGKTASGSNQVRLQQFQTGTSNSAFSGLSQQVRLVQNPTPTATKVVAKQQVQAKPQPKPVQTSIVQQAKKPTAQSLSSTTSPGGTSVISASSGASIGSLPPSALQALGANFGGGGAGGGQSHIVVKTLSLDAKDADPSSEAFKKALAEATKQARLELGVSESEELGVASGDLANLFGKKRRKRQLFGGESSSNAQTVGNALSTGAGLFDDDDVDNADEELE